MRVKGDAEVSSGENQIVVYQPNETVRLDVCTKIIPGILHSIHKATTESREYGQRPKSQN